MILYILKGEDRHLKLQLCVLLYFIIFLCPLLKRIEFYPPERERAQLLATNLLEYARQYCSSTLACIHTRIGKILFVVTINMPKMQLKNS